MKAIRAVATWTVAVISFLLLALSYTRAGTGFAGTGNGLIWSYLFAVLLVFLVLAPVLRRPMSAQRMDPAGVEEPPKRSDA